MAWSSRLGVGAAGQSPLLMAKGKSLKILLEILWIDATYVDISYVRGLYD
jgi:hypothetical protein